MKETRLPKAETNNSKMLEEQKPDKSFKLHKGNDIQEAKPKAPLLQKEKEKKENLAIHSDSPRQISKSVKPIKTQK